MAEGPTSGYGPGRAVSARPTRIQAQALAFSKREVHDARVSAKRPTSVGGISRQEARDALISVRAMILHVPPRDLRQAIASTDGERLETLTAVELDGQTSLACAWESGGQW